MLHSSASSDRSAAYLSQQWQKCCTAQLLLHPEPFPRSQDMLALLSTTSGIISISQHPTPINRSFFCFPRQELAKCTCQLMNVVLPLQVSLQLHVAYTAYDVLYSNVIWSSGACPYSPLPHTGISPTFSQNNLSLSGLWRGTACPKVTGWWYSALFMLSHCPTEGSMCFRSSSAILPLPSVNLPSLTHLTTDVTVPAIHLDHQSVPPPFLLSRW